MDTMIVNIYSPVIQPRTAFASEMVLCFYLRYAFAVQEQGSKNICSMQPTDYIVFCLIAKFKA